jgi:hypothetical protein
MAFGDGGVGGDRSQERRREHRDEDGSRQRGAERRTDVRDGVLDAADLAALGVGHRRDGHAAQRRTGRPKKSELQPSWCRSRLHCCPARVQLKRRRRLEPERVDRMWSGCRDLNPGPPAPKAGALPSCATSREIAGSNCSPSRVVCPSSAASCELSPKHGALRHLHTKSSIGQCLRRRRFRCGALGSVRHHDLASVGETPGDVKQGERATAPGQTFAAAVRLGDVCPPRRRRGEGLTMKGDIGATREAAMNGTGRGWVVASGAVFGVAQSIAVASSIFWLPTTPCGRSWTRRSASW